MIVNTYMGGYLSTKSEKMSESSLITTVWMKSVQPTMHVSYSLKNS